jgi:hypothetical protein
MSLEYDVAVANVSVTLPLRKVNRTAAMATLRRSGWRIAGWSRTSIPSSNAGRNATPASASPPSARSVLGAEGQHVRLLLLLPSRELRMGLHRGGEQV